MPVLMSTLPVFVPAAMVAAGWIVVLRKKLCTHWRMALLTTSLAVFFFGIALGLVRYHQFGINVGLMGSIETSFQLRESLREVVMIFKTSSVALVVHLMLAALAFEAAAGKRGVKS